MKQLNMEDAMRLEQMWARMAQEDGVVRNAIESAKKSRALYEAMHETCASIAARDPKKGSPLFIQLSQALKELEVYRLKSERASAYLNKLHAKFVGVYSKQEVV